MIAAAGACAGLIARLVQSSMLPVPMERVRRLFACRSVRRGDGTSSLLTPSLVRDATAVSLAELSPEYESPEPPASARRSIRDDDLRRGEAHPIGRGASDSGLECRRSAGIHRWKRFGGLLCLLDREAQPPRRLRFQIWTRATPIGCRVGPSPVVPCVAFCVWRQQGLSWVVATSHVLIDFKLEDVTAPLRRSCPTR